MAESSRRYQFVDALTGEFIRTGRGTPEDAANAAELFSQEAGRKVRAEEIPETNFRTTAARGASRGLVDLIGLGTFGAALARDALPPGKLRNILDVGIGSPEDQQRVQNEFARRPDENPLVFGAARGIAGGIPTLPFGGGGATPLRSALRLGGEVSSSATGGAAAEAAEEAGAGFVGQFASGVAGGVAPNALARGGVAGTQFVARRVGDSARSAAGRAAAAQRLVDQVGGMEAFNDVVSAVRASMDDRIPTTVSQAGSVVSPALVGLERRTFRGASGPNAGAAFREIARQRDEAQIVTAEVLSGVLPGGDTADFLLGIRSAREKAWAGVKTAYEKLSNGRGQPVHAGRLKKVAKVLRDPAGEFGDELSDHLPHEVLELIDSYEGTLSFTQLERFRSKVTEEIAKESKPGFQKHKNRQKLRALSLVMSEVEGTLDDIIRRGAASGENSVALRAAVAARREFAGKFEEKFVQAIDSFEDMNRWFAGNVLKHKKPVEAVQILRRAILESGLPADEASRAWAGLQQIGQDAIFGPEFFADISPSSVKKAMTALRRNRPVYDTLFGEGATSDALSALGETRLAQRGSVGTEAFFRQTGTGDSPPLNQFAALQAFRGNWRDAIASTFSMILRRSVSRDDVNNVLARAFSDKQFFIDLKTALRTRDVGHVQNLLGVSAPAAAARSLNRAFQPLIINDQQRQELQ